MITPPDGVPVDALAIRYSCKGHSTRYFLWKRLETVGVTEDGDNIKEWKWYWHALGGSGKEDCAQDATYAARQYIANGIKSLSSR